MERNPLKMTPEKIRLFRECFAGLTHVYGTYDVRTGRVRQVKEPVTDRVILAHLQGAQSYGVYLLVKDRTRAIAADFDSDDLWAPMEFVAAARNYNLPAYLERSKAKGYHGWIFFEESGILAAKARLIVRHLLDEIEHPDTEVFPKQDALDPNVTYGNFINAPLFGALVPQGRTVFVDPREPTKPHPDQWDLLRNIERVTEPHLDEAIQVNALELPAGRSAIPASTPSRARHSFGLPPCARTMLAHGVTANQRVACFRLAVNLKKVGLPLNSALAVLAEWADRNEPAGDRRVITAAEIVEQATCAYAGPYRSCGCEDPAVTPHCDPSCPVRNGRRRGQASRDRRLGPPQINQQSESDRK
ncbi:MAG: hypothetical protein KJ749_03300 [Planctomycetes bacterium]|nr:hypothetical protein [Planctomycetota bacterium]